MKNSSLALRLKETRERRATKQDAGDVVQTVILIAGFVIVSVLIVLWMSTAVLNKGVDAAKCVEGSGRTYNGNQAEGTSACQGTTAAQGNNSFEKDESYVNRY